MLVERELLDNKYDPQAMIIKINKINASLHGDVTKEAKGKQPQQKVKDIAGKTVGRVPANVFKLFNKVLTDGDVTKITCSSVDAPTLSTIPPSQQSFKKNQK